MRSGDITRVAGGTRVDLVLHCNSYMLNAIGIKLYNIPEIF